MLKCVGSYTVFEYGTTRYRRASAQG
eukprot:COSAG02_NODE_23586_length_714_cov_0.923577_1_plen_25_part_10